MNDQEYNERLGAIEELALHFPSAELTEQNIKGYLWSLSDLSQIAIRAAIERCINTSKFFPTVAEIRENAEAVNVEQTKPPVDCSRCFGTGLEQYREGGYANMRRCDHAPITTEEDADVDNW